MKKWVIQASETSRRTFNPIRAIVDGMNLQPNPAKEMIPLSIGDPAAFPNLPPAPNVLEAVKAAVASVKYNGYPMSIGSYSATFMYSLLGYPTARAAIAKFCAKPTAPLQAEVRKRLLSMVMHRTSLLPAAARVPSRWLFQVFV